MRAIERIPIRDMSEKSVVDDEVCWLSAVKVVL